MNPIISALVKDFCLRHELADKSESDRFEKFVAHCALAAEKMEQGDFKDAITDKGEEGIDSIAILINGDLILDAPDVAELAREGELDVKYIFTQAKTGEKWDGGDVLKFTRAVSAFFDQSADIGTSSVVASAREVHEAVLENAVQLAKLKIVARYATTGRIPAEDEESGARKYLDELHAALTAKELFSDVDVSLLGATQLRDLYRSASSAATAKILFTLKVTLPKIEGVEQAYLGMVPAAELLRLLQDGEGGLRRSIFDDNVRDFQGAAAPVNDRMLKTIQGEHSDRFAVMNNGITVVARDLNNVGDAFTLTDYQVVNGAQTSNVIYLAREALVNSSNVYIPMRLIQTRDEDLINSVVTATNSQTAISSDQLNARKEAERNIEKFFAATEAPRNLLYERRSGQYDGQAEVTRARVIDRSTLVRAVAATFMDEPHLATGYQTQLMSRLSGNPQAGRRGFFLDDHEADLYYAAASAYYRSDLWLKTGRLEPRYKSARWHLLAIARKLSLETDMPDFSDKRFRAWVQPFLDAVWDDVKGPELFQMACRIVDRSNIDLKRSAFRNSSASTDIAEALKWWKGGGGC